MEALLNLDSLTTLFTLSALEIVLGIDNLVMIAILVSNLPTHKQGMGRSLGIGFALFTRCCLLFTMSWLAGLIEPLFSIANHPFSIRDLVLFIGGLFLLYKGLKELHELSCADEECSERKALGNSVALIVLQIGLFDIVFSLDSVITAVGMSNQLPIMITAVCVAMAVMLFASGPIIKIINKFIEIKVVALCFLLLIGIMLVVNGLGIHFSKGYIYSAMGFAVFTQAAIIVVRNAKSNLESNK